jgi:phage terminase large subunit GpA-like protein
LARGTYVEKTSGVLVYNVDTDAGKNWLHEMLKAKNPRTAHFSCGPNGETVGGWDPEATAEVTAEYLQEYNRYGYTKKRWHKVPGRPNHRLDCWLYALAALHIARLKIDDCDIVRTEARNVGTQKEKGSLPKRSGYGAQSSTLWSSAPPDAPRTASGLPWITTK